MKVYTVVWMEDQWEVSAQYQGAFPSVDKAIEHIKGRFEIVTEEETGYKCCIDSSLNDKVIKYFIGKTNDGFSEPFDIVIIEEDIS